MILNCLSRFSLINQITIKRFTAPWHVCNIRTLSVSFVVDTSRKTKRKHNHFNVSNIVTDFALILHFAQLKINPNSEKGEKNCANKRKSFLLTYFHEHFLFCAPALRRSFFFFSAVSLQ